MNEYPKIKVANAIKQYGKPSLLAKRLSISRSAISKWVHVDKREYLPFARALDLIRTNPELAE